MTSQLVALVTGYAHIKNVFLDPNWAADIQDDLHIEELKALEQLCRSVGWPIRYISDKPQLHAFPALAFHPLHGWGVAQSWVSSDHISLLTANGLSDVDWADGVTTAELGFPGLGVASGSQRAIGIFWSAILKRKAMIVDATIATVVINLIALATSIYSMQIYDRVIPRAGYATLIVLTAGMVFALLIDMLIRNTRAIMIDREAGTIDSEVSGYFYSRMQAVRLDARPRSIGTMAAQLRGTDQVRSLLSSASLFVLADLPFAFLFMGVMAWLGGIVALVPLIAFPLALVLAAVMARFIRTDTAAAQVNGNRKNGQLVEALDTAETIKANLGGWHMLANWSRLVDEVHGHDLKVKRWSVLSGSGFSFIQQLAYVGVVCVGAIQVAQGHMTMGAVIACSILSGRVNGPLVASLPNLIIQWGYARSSLSALDGILAMPSDNPEDRQMLRQRSVVGNLTAENVKFVHQGTRQGIDVASLNIAAGDRIGIIGPVGSGKSTLLKLLAGLYAPQEGHILLDGVDVRQIAEEDLRRQVCYFPQDYRLITGTLRDNLALGISTPTDEVLLDAAMKTGLAAVIKRHPLGLDLPISEGGQGLSGGQRLQVGITRLLLLKPRLLLLDEPTASLDQDSETRALQAIAQTVSSDCTLILVTHKMQLVGLVSRLLVVSDGHVVLDGPTKAVLDKLRSTSRNSPSATTQSAVKASINE